MRPDVLILADSDDPHARDVSRELQQRGVKCATVITPELGSTVFLALDPLTGIGEIETPDFELRLDQVGVIWNRRVRPPDLSRVKQHDVREILETECMALWTALLDTTARPVANRPWANDAASRKGLQLNYVAKHCPEFVLPQTLLTNSAPKVRDFSVDRQVCAKLQHGASLEGPRGTVFAYTQLLDERRLAALDRLGHSPAIFQTYFRKAFELRVVAFRSGVVMATKMDTQASPVSLVDSRQYDFERVRYSPFDLPASQADACLRVVRAFELSYGVFDLAVGPDGTVCFLEMNPNGQWLWLQDHGGPDLVAAFASNLLYELESSKSGTSTPDSAPPFGSGPRGV